ncbi:CLUMA_CG019006, isoform A, partial [Clunio marinus]
RIERGAALGYSLVLVRVTSQFGRGHRGVRSCGSRPEQLSVEEIVAICFYNLIVTILSYVYTIIRHHEFIIGFN